MEFAMQEKGIEPVLSDLQQRLPRLCAFCLTQCLLIFLREPEAIWFTLKSLKIAAGGHDNQNASSSVLICDHAAVFKKSKVASLTIICQVVTTNMERYRVLSLLGYTSLTNDNIG